ncbi:glucans biosynthesis glucosyltransferase MdoH [Neoroseomonas soli]|uniref:glucans biosynthesis glucosyltransferase MdoH n=1 Tax=Neoroseomonas soli TaxID=1081025 RepID=UPI0030BA027B
MSESIILRRAAFLCLVLAITAGLVALAVAVLAPGGWTGWEVLILACFLGTIPWSALSAANALVGLAILLGAKDPPAAVLPALRAARPGPPRGRTAIAICVRNEDMAAVLPPLGRLMDGLPADRFALWVLSDTPAGPVAEAEEAAFRAFARDRPCAHYRRRAVNEGFKAGNVMDFLDHHAAGLDYFLCLDADSEMTPQAVLRLVACLEADERLAIVQQLIHGRPATAAFPRLFQFGMRQGMRAWAMGQAWWQGDEGPYWGHNAIIRIAPFRELCRLGPLPDGSRILSHDQVEATRLHAAGWKVRVLPDDTGSAEGNPPTFGDFVTRDLRWAGGNMQYLALLRLPGLTPMARWQLVQAILLFLGAPLWCAILVLAAANALAGGGGGAATPTGALVALLAATWACHYAPKLAGYAEVLLKPALAARHGGRAAFARGAAAEIAFTTLMEPARLMAQTLFLLALPFGLKVGWAPQNRADRGVTWADAARQFWPPTLAGIVLTVAFAVASPLALLLALPVLASLLLAVPFAVVTADPAFSAWLRRAGICALPEEIGTPIR